jgi:hypothetical protein
LPTNSILNYWLLRIGGKEIKTREKIRFKKLIVKLKMGVLEKPSYPNKECPMKSKVRCLILFCATSFIANIAESDAQVSLTAHSNLVFVEYKDFKEGQFKRYSPEPGSTRTNLLPVAIGLEARVKIFALNISAEAFSLPTVDLIMGVRASFVIYPLQVGPVEPFVAANTGSVSGEDTKGSETSGLGAGVACRVSKKMQLVAQMTRLHFSFYNDIQLKNDVYEIAVGPKFSF